MIGGFLGAGKTTSVIELAKFLDAEGKRVGVITNDQAEDLVDTQLVRRSGFDVQEIAGGCFCCRFSSLKDAADQLTQATRPDVFIAEPVGSCTDLIATVSYPLRRMYGDDYTIAPLSVLLDPHRALRVFGIGEGKRFSQKIEYIYKKQIEESQFIVINKCDSLNETDKKLLKYELERYFPEKTQHWVSAKTGEGLSDWFGALSSQVTHSLPSNTMKMDYKEYAVGEALLGWLNASLSLKALDEIDGNAFLKLFCQLLCKNIDANGGNIAHLKATLKPKDDDYEMASYQVVDNESIPELGLLLSDEIEEGELVINARAEIKPADLMKALDQSLVDVDDCFIELKILHCDHFAPAEPVPEYRIEVSS
jgi:G3E family GTPase